MSSHIAHPGVERIHDLNGPDPILYDGCPRCEEHAADPFVGLDKDFSRALWRKMVAVEHENRGAYRSVAEAQACHKFYKIAVWFERQGVPSWGLLT